MLCMIRQEIAIPLNWHSIFIFLGSNDAAESQVNFSVLGGVLPKSLLERCQDADP